MYFTIFTPTYNRAYILDKAYDSLLRQSFSSFKWVIIDDGSTDETSALADGWIKEGKIDIIYEWQMNQGKFAAHNNAIKYFEGELLVLLNSDDFLEPHALETLYNCWEKEKKHNYSGIIYYMHNKKNNIIGTLFPSNLAAERTYVLRDKYRMKGDKGVCFSITEIKKHKYPIINGEKFIGDSFIMDLINESAPMYILREALYVREYLENGLTNNLTSTWCHSPIGMALFYNQTLTYIRYDKLKYLIYAMKYVCFAHMSKQKNIIAKANKKKAAVFMYIPGLIYCQYLLMKNKK